MKSKFEGWRRQVPCFQPSVPRFPLKTGGGQPIVEKLYEMNVRPTLREAALIRRMKFWLLRALHGPLGNCSKSRGVKNYLALVRKHGALAEKAGFRETDIYR
jgi:hypothetical protein